MGLNDYFTEATKDREMMRKGCEAAARFLVKKGYDVEDENTYFDLVAVDNDTGDLVFIDVFVKDRCEEPEIDRTEVEGRMLKTLVRNIDFSDMPIRYDRIVIVPIENRALLRHHVNVMRDAGI